MKGQLSFEYYFALIMFVIFVTFLFFKLITFFPFYDAEVTSQRLRSEAYQISELLINDVGNPSNWHDPPEDAVNAVRLGLSDETMDKTNLISVDKAQVFKTLCDDDYNQIIEKLNIKDNFWVVLVDDGAEPPKVLIECSPEDTTARFRANVTRIVSFDDGSFGELRVSVWE